MSNSGDKSRVREREGNKNFTRKQYFELKERGAIRLLNVIAQDDNSTILCELIPSTILTEKELVEEFGLTQQQAKAKFIPYEALSWSWGSTDVPMSFIYIVKDHITYKKAVKEDLVHALRALRHPTHGQLLWIDAICINQDNIEERNHQVEMMADIYGKAERVRVWLGPQYDSSNIAIEFIKNEILRLENFDKLCEDKSNRDKWIALLKLMQRPWFSRRWVVQEIALARTAIIHCGKDKISWKKFAIAVELFIEVETVTHRLSEVMQKDNSYYYVPGWFDNVSALGASLLVEATGRLFRDYTPEQKSKRVEPTGTGGVGDEMEDPESDVDDVLATEDAADSDSEDDGPIAVTKGSSADDNDNEDYDTDNDYNDEQEHPRIKGQPLLSLQYLVTSLSVFDTSNSHDTIYALLAIARDTTPTASTQKLHVLDHTQSALERFTQRKQYTVEYGSQYVDVCKEFIHFCVSQSLHTDPSRALDVICRPWATEQSNLPKSRTIWVKSEKSGDKPEAKTIREMQLPSWVPQLSGAPFGMDYRAGIGKRMGRKNADILVGLPDLSQKNYSAAETKKLDVKIYRFRKRVAKVELRDRWGEPSTPPKDSKVVEHAGVRDGQDAEKTRPEGDSRPTSQQSGRDLVKEGKVVKLNHFSMYIRGFELDEVTHVQSSSQNGSIPKDWAIFAGWGGAHGNPPPEFWRTLVADRGRDGRNPPVYYARACKESFQRGGFLGGAINDVKSSVVAQFCRRVQAAIWNRALIKTQNGHLGLVGKDVRAGDKVCILYGCSVPIILRAKRTRKSKDDIAAEIQWELEFLKTRMVEDWRKHSARVEAFCKKREEDKKKFADWKVGKENQWKNDKQWKETWRSEIEELKKIHEFNAWLRDKGGSTEKGKDGKLTSAAKEMHGWVNKWLEERTGYKPSEKEQKKKEEFEKDQDWKNNLKKRVELSKNQEWREKCIKGNTTFDESPLDSFRAWLRNKGKFVGTENAVEYMKEWQEYDIRRHEWKGEKDGDKFREWMTEKPEKLSKETLDKIQQWEKAEDWSKQWRSHPNNHERCKAEEYSAWANEQDENSTAGKHNQKPQQSTNLGLREELKQPIPKILEAWRIGWQPHTGPDTGTHPLSSTKRLIDWEEFEIMLKYGKRWRSWKRKRDDYLKREEKKWDSPEAIQKRQRDRIHRASSSVGEILQAPRGGGPGDHDGSKSADTPDSEDSAADREQSEDIEALSTMLKKDIRSELDIDLIRHLDLKKLRKYGEDMYYLLAIFRILRGFNTVLTELHKEGDSVGKHNCVKEAADMVASMPDFEEFEMRMKNCEDRTKQTFKLTWEKVDPKRMRPNKETNKEESMPRYFRRPRLSEDEKRTYEESVEKNYRKWLGDDIEWHYKMLGEAYIHGMMDGEAMKYQNIRGISTKVFEIR